MKKSRNSTAAAPSRGAPSHHNCGDYVFPFFESWRKKYGQVFMFFPGSTLILRITQPDVFREITTCTSLDLGKPLYQPRNPGPCLVLLYPPVAIISREVLRDMKFKDINIPKEVCIWTLALTLHIDPEVWGADAHQFNPERFANGVNGTCKLPHLYMPFGVGPRVCLGQHLAMVEMKLLISLILSNFSFSLSSTYVHFPSVNLIVEPQHRLNLNKKL